MDLVSTYIGITYFGIMEGNGFQGAMIHKFGFPLYMIINLMFSLVILELVVRIENKFIRETVLNGFIILNSLVVIINFFLIFSA